MRKKSVRGEEEEEEKRSPENKKLTLYCSRSRLMRRSRGGEPSVEGFLRIAMTVSCGDNERERKRRRGLIFFFERRGLERDEVLLLLFFFSLIFLQISYKKTHVPDCHWEDRVALVVDVLADEVDAS